MKVSLKKKLKIIMPIVLLVVIALGGVVAYAVWQHMGRSDDTTSTSLESVPEYGACELTTTAAIKATFGGDKITQITEGLRQGETAPNGTQAEACKYAFTTQATASNSFTVSIYEYTSSANGSDKETVGEGWSEVGGSTPIAYFHESTENDGKVTVFQYRVLPGSKNILLTLRQPTNALTYGRDAAFDFIGGIAAKLNLSAFEAPEEGDPNSEPGAVTENP